MRRETSNKIRFVIEDLLPPIVKDSALFRVAARVGFGRMVDMAADFRRRAATLTNDEYGRFYQFWPRVHAGTDNSRACLSKIAGEIIGNSVCDVGCGTGYLLRYIQTHSPEKPARLVGTEIVVPEHPDEDGIEYHQGFVERLPFRDQEFDTVVCTHLIEHILDYRAAIAELRRVSAQRLVIVVPMEREAIYSFNPHFNFFPYPHSFLRAMIPLPASYVCEAIGRDIYYREDIGSHR